MIKTDLKPRVPLFDENHSTLTEVKVRPAFRSTSLVLKLVLFLNDTTQVMITAFSSTYLKAMVKYFPVCITKIFDLYLKSDLNPKYIMKVETLIVEVILNQSFNI